MYKIFSIIFLLVFTTNGLWAGSVLSSSGLGLPTQYADASAMGMGGVSIAVPNSMCPAKINPAGLFPIQTTRFDLQYYYENNQYKDHSGEAESAYSNFDGFTFAVPIGLKTVIALGISSLTRMDYRLNFENELNDEIYEKSIEGSGGLNTTSLSFSYRPFKYLALGLKGDFIFGKITEKWHIRYDNYLFNPTTSDFTTMNWGFGWTAGFMLMPTSRWVFGAVYTPAATIENSTEAISFNESNSRILVLEEEDGQINFPGRWGAGLTFLPRKNIMISTEYTYNNWKNLQFNNAAVHNIQSSGSYALGMEWQPSSDPYDKFLKQFAYRLGASYKPLYMLDANGNEIIEQTITVGFGIPIKNLNSRIQLGLAYGKRGSLDKNGISENLFRIHASIAAGEKWFIRTY